MKLRVRALDSRDTLRIDIPGDSSLQTLKDAIARAIPVPPFPSPSSLRLSLNRSDELSASDPHDSLLSLGIAAGDLIYYYVVSDQNRETLGGSVPLDSVGDSQRNRVTSLETPSEESVVDLNDCISEEGGEEEDFGGAIMEIDEESGKFPESGFKRRLIRVLSKDLGEEGFDHKLMVVAVDSVLLESGFVQFDSVSGKKVDKLEFPSSMAFTLSLHYTVPEILERNGRESVVLKFQNLKHFANVFGSLNYGGSTYRLCLDERRFVPIIGSVCSGEVGDESEKELYELWKIVKDGLALPLMIDLCAKAGLPGPACFSRLPAELQMKILELLPGDDLAKAGCVCKELRYLSCNNDLWMRKFGEEFGFDKRPQGSSILWKTAFSKSRRRKRIAEDIRGAARRRACRIVRSPPLFALIWRDPPNPFGVPRIGGDYDRFPESIIAPNWQPPSQRSFSPNCNLGSRFDPN